MSGDTGADLVTEAQATPPGSRTTGIDEQERITAAEASRLTGFTPRQIRIWASLGLLRSELDTTGRKTFRKDEILAFRPPPALWGPSEAAFRLGISLSELYRHVRLGNLPVRRTTGNRLAFHPDDLAPMRVRPSPPP
ncbi:MerR family transcriptional regulator [Jatrophihabitans telluris]|uniref:MerR family transcriptional regulator n=1 Tax=Jatrophihabitans telluris TaxID=2038343 RepID=A0ABY4QXG9_9ACTN|nr:MerR family transcriptional regulator [Jatrophihabitans telluris]UQX87600.1 MerR family transcriptional regulator [Jatrophihabitans telluris]